MVVTQWECGAVVRHSACIYELPTVYFMFVTPIYSTSTCWTPLLLGCKHTAVLRSAFKPRLLLRCPVLALFLPVCRTQRLGCCWMGHLHHPHLSLR